MNTAIWICQAVLALAMLYSGSCKATQNKNWLIAHGQTGVAPFSPAAIRAIGVVELLGVAGMILPEWLQIAPALTTLTAAGFAIVMVLASRIHARLREPGNAALNIVLMAMSLFVAWGRFPG